MHFKSIKPVLSDHLSYVTIFHCFLRRSHMTGLTVFVNNNLMLRMKPNYLLDECSVLNLYR